jgi:hypothetical protein
VQYSANKIKTIVFIAITIKMLIIIATNISVNTIVFGNLIVPQVAKHSLPVRKHEADYCFHSSPPVSPTLSKKNSVQLSTMPPIHTTGASSLRFSKLFHLINDPHSKKKRISAELQYLNCGIPRERRVGR